MSTTFGTYLSEQKFDNLNFVTFQIMMLIASKKKKQLKKRRKDMSVG
jgi:hypothetical protein